MNEIQNSQIRPDTFMKAHHLRHLISGTIVFTMGVAVNEGLVKLRHHCAQPVIWIGEAQTGQYVPPDRLPGTNATCQFGVRADGTVVWRVKP